MSKDGPGRSPKQHPLTTTLDIDVVHHGTSWEKSGVSDAAVELAAQAAFASSPPPGRTAFEVTILLTDDTEMRTLNRTWRDKDEPTNVLSFPASDAPGQCAAPGQSAHLGDVIVAYETSQAEADEKRITLPDHVSHLVVHGLLHLLGFDHVEDNQAEQMEELERRALATLSIADPYSGDVGASMDAKAHHLEMKP